MKYCICHTQQVGELLVSIYNSSQGKGCKLHPRYCELTSLYYNLGETKCDCTPKNGNTALITENSFSKNVKLFASTSETIFILYII